MLISQAALDDCFYIIFFTFDGKNETGIQKVFGILGGKHVSYFVADKYFSITSAMIICGKNIPPVQ